MKEFYRLKEVVSITTLSRPTIYRLIATGNFPKPIEISKRVRCWKAEDIHEWVDRVKSSNNLIGN